LYLLGQARKMRRSRSLYEPACPGGLRCLGDLLAIGLLQSKQPQLVPSIASADNSDRRETTWVVRVPLWRGFRLLKCLRTDEAAAYLQACRMRHSESGPPRM